MKILRIAAWTVWFILGWTMLAHAGPVAAAIGAISGILKAGGIAATMIKLGFGIALNVASSLLQKAMAKRQPEPGITGQVQMGGDKSLSFIVGSYATAGHLEYINTHGQVGKTPNAILNQIITVSDLPVYEISNRAWVNGKKCTRDPSIDPRDSAAKFGPNSFPVSEYKLDRMEIWFLFLTYYLGDQTTADASMVSAYGGSERPWPSDMIGRGVSYVVTSAEVQRELMTAIPNFRFEVKGLRLYDPRKDSTVGGSGPHRWGQEHTYEWTDNPAVIIYNIMRGIYYQGEWIYGPEIPAVSLPVANWFAAMNECDVLIPLDGGGSEKQYRAGYEIKVNDHEPKDVIEELLKACNGHMAEMGGTYKIRVGAPGLPVAFITDADFVDTEEQEFDQFPGLEQTYNGVTATYPEPEAAWEMKDAPQRRFPEYEAQDEGRILLADVQFNAVPFPLQVQRLMTSLAHDNRRFRKHFGTMPPWSYVLEPLDVISYTSARNGYIDKQFLIESMDDQDNVNQAIAMVEVDPSDYDWKPSDTLPWSVGPLVPSWPLPQIMSGWHVQPATIGIGNKQLPSIEVFFDGDLADVRAVRVQARLVANGEVSFDGEVPYGDRLGEPGLKSVILNGSFLPDSDYEVRGVYVPFSPRAADWSAWLPVRTPNVWISDVYDVDLDMLADDIRGLIEWGAGGLREVERRLEEYDLWMADQDFGNAYDRQLIRKQLTATFDNARAEWKYDVQVVASENYALAQRVETISASVNDNTASIQSEATARATADSALAADISTLEASVFNPTTGLPAVASAVSGLEAYSGPGGTLAQAFAQLSAATDPNNVATANWRMETVAGPAGYSRLAFTTRYGGAGAYRGAAFGLDTPANAALPTRFWADAQNFVFMDTSSGATINPLIYSNGIWRMNVANIGTVTAGTVRSPNNKFIIDVANGKIEWFD